MKANVLLRILLGSLVGSVSVSVANAQPFGVSPVKTTWEYQVSENDSCSLEFVRLSEDRTTERGCIAVAKTVDSATANFYFDREDGGTVNFITEPEGYELRAPGQSLYVLKAINLRPTPNEPGAAVQAPGFCLLDTQDDRFSIRCKARARDVIFRSAFTTQK